jgi:hypothetical protein
MILGTFVTSFHKIPQPSHAQVQLQNPIHTWLVYVFMMDFFFVPTKTKKQEKRRCCS